MKWKTLILTLAFGLAMSTGAWAQTAALKIGYMDLSKVFDNYGETKAFDKVLEADHDQYVKERQAKVQLLMEKQNKLDLLKDQEKTQLQQQITQMADDLRKFDQAQRADLTKKRDEKIREILLQIEKTVSDFAKKNHYDIILNDRVLIYGGEKYDVTDQVLKILNDNYNKNNK